VASGKAKYVVVGLAIAVLLSAALLSTPALAESTYSLLRDVLSKVTDVKTTLSPGGTIYGMIDQIKSTVTTNLNAKISDVQSAISALDTKLGAFTTTDNLKAVIGGYTAASPLKSAIDSIISTVGTINTNLGIVKGYLEKGGAIYDMISAIKAKTDLLSTWGDIVTKNWADLTGYIDTAKAAIITEVDTRLSTADFKAWASDWTPQRAAKLDAVAQVTGETLTGANIPKSGSPKDLGAVKHVTLTILATDDGIPGITIPTGYEQPVAVYVSIDGIDFYPVLALSSYSAGAGDKATVLAQFEARYFYLPSAEELGVASIDAVNYVAISS